MRKVFILTQCKFPRGGALANYVQYLAKGIEKAGFKPIVVAELNQELISSNESYIIYQNIDVACVSFSKSRIIRHFTYRNQLGKQILSAFEHYKIDSKDIVITFRLPREILDSICKKQNKVGFKVIADVLELFSKCDYENEKDCEAAETFFNSYCPQFQSVWGISSFITTYFKTIGCKHTFCIPIMADVNEYKFVPKQFRGKYNVILPSNGKMKDALPEMLRCLLRFSNEDLDKFSLHLCGVKKETFDSILTVDEQKKLQNCIVRHEWMKYDELIELYSNMHFLFLARQDCQMTRANFPSKIPETMGYGIVPICSDVGDYTKYYLENNVNSLFIDTPDEASCYSALLNAVNMEWSTYEKLSQNARILVEEKFDYHVWAERIRNELESI